MIIKKEYQNIYDCLQHLWFMISIKKRSSNAIEYREQLHAEIVGYIDFIAKGYHVSNSLLNYTFNLAEEYSHFKYNFHTIFKYDGVWINDSYKYSITMG